MSEPMEIEVRISQGNHWRQLATQRATLSDPYLRFTAEPAPGSITEARLRLAEAAEALDRAHRWGPAYYETGRALQDALAAVRALRDK